MIKKSLIQFMLSWIKPIQSVVFYIHFLHSFYKSKLFLENIPNLAF